MKLRVGLVGLGDQWSVRHAPALRALSDRFQVTAVCCEVAERSNRVAKEFGAVATDGFRALLQRDDVDALMLLSPEWYGPLPIQAACDAGKAVYSSASLDFTPEQATEVRLDIRKSGVPFMAELPLRYAPATIRLKELIATRLGKPRLLFCHRRLPLESQSDRLRRGKHCPLVWRNMMELVDWCRYIVGADPASVLSSAHGNYKGNPETYYQMASLDFRSCQRSTDTSHATQSVAIRPLAQLSVGHYIPQRWTDALSFRRPAALQVCCEKGLAFIDLPSSLVWFDDAGQHSESLDAERAVGEMMLDRFHRLATNQICNSTDAHDADAAMKIVLGANKSIESGDRIDLDF
jgi:predicted dehydrogenase